jgi:hypothetical protein
MPHASGGKTIVFKAAAKSINSPARRHPSPAKAGRYKNAGNSVRAVIPIVGTSAFAGACEVLE